MKSLHILLFILIYNNLYCNTFFVALNGNDNNNGTIFKPFATIKGALNNLIEGDTLYIREGIYFEPNIILNKSNIYISNFENEKVEIHNTNKLESFSIENNIIKSKIGNKAIQVFCNNKLQTCASFPNVKEGGFDVKNWATSIAYSNSSVNIPNCSNYKRDNNTFLIGLFGDKLISICDTVINSSGNYNYLNNSSWFWSSTSYYGDGISYLKNNFEFLDIEGEWFSNDSILYFIPESTNNNLDNHIEYRSNVNGLDLSNSTNITIAGITFFACRAILKNASNCILKNCHFLYPVPFFTFEQGFEKFSPNGINGYEDPENWNGSGPNWSKYDGPESWHGNGIEISGENNTIENCYIAHSWGDGLTVWGKGHKIFNNIITDCNWIGMDCAPLNISGSEHLIQFNELSYAGRSVLLHRFLENSKILNNHIHHGGLLCNDQGLTYAFWTDGKGTEIAYNYLHDNLGKKNQAGIYLDNWTYNFNLHHNIIVNAGTGININKPHNNLKIYQNTLYNNTYSMGSWGPDKTTVRNVTTFNNLTNTNKKEKWNYDSFYGTQLDSNYLYNNNPFEDPFTNDFRLKEYAYPIDRGIKNEFTTDYINLPDIGAYEFGEKKRKVGARLTIPCVEYEIPFPAYDLSLDFNTNDTTFLKWTYYSSGIDTFLIERRKSEEENFQTIGYTSNSVFNYYDTTKNLFGSYIYQVRVKNKFGISEPTNSIKVFKSNYSQAIVLEAERNDDYKGITISKDQISNCDNLNYVAFKQIDLENNYDACIIRYAVPCEYAFQNVQIRLDNANGKIIGQYITLPTGGWSKFDTISIPITAVKGIHDIYFVFKGEFGVGTFDWFTFIKSNKTIVSTRSNTDTNCVQIINKQKTIPVILYPNPGFGDLKVSFINNETIDVGIEIYSYEGLLIFKNDYPEKKEGEVEIYINEELFDYNKQQSMFLVKVKLKNEKRNQESVLKYIRI